jgi:hypothetical protein
MEQEKGGTIPLKVKQLIQAEIMMKLIKLNEQFQNHKSYEGRYVSGNNTRELIT